MEHWKWNFWIDSFVMELVTVLFWRAFAAVFLISCSKGGAGFVLSRGLDTSKVYFVIPDSSGGMAPTTGYGTEPGSVQNKRTDKEQSLNDITQEIDHVIDKDPMPCNKKDLVMGSYNQLEVPHGEVKVPENFKENSEDEEDGTVPEKREKKDLKEKEIIDEDDFLRVIPLTKPVNLG